MVDNRILCNLADPRCGMLRVSAAFHDLRFLQTIHLLSLIVVLVLVLSVPTLFAMVEHSKLEKMEFCATIHASFKKPGQWSTSGCMILQHSV